MTTFELNPLNGYIFCGFEDGKIISIHKSNDIVLDEVQTSLRDFGFDY